MNVSLLNLKNCFGNERNIDNTPFVCRTSSSTNVIPTINYGGVSQFYGNIKNSQKAVATNILHSYR